MEREKLDEIYQKATDAAVTRFKELADDLEDRFVFETGMNLAESTFRNTIISIERERGVLPESKIYYLAFDGWQYCGDMVRDHCRKELLLLEKERSIKQIRRTTAGVIIEPKIKEIGLPYLLEFQKYRLKISLRLNWERHFEFYIKYRDFNNPGILDELLERTRYVLEYIQLFGPQLTIRDNDPNTVWIDPDADR